MPDGYNKDASRLFKSVPKEFDPRITGTIRIGSLSFYREHYDEAVADPGEGTGIVSISANESVTIPAIFASSLFSIKVMGEEVPQPGKVIIKIEEPGVRMELDVPRKEVTIKGAACTWEFTALDALVFCMTAPSKFYVDAFQGNRVIWSIDKSNADEFANLLVSGIDQTYPAESSFPFLSIEAAQGVGNVFEHGPVEYAPRTLALKNTEEGRLAAILFTDATFIKPSGAPRNFEKEEEYRFQFRRSLSDGRAPHKLPQFIDIPFSLVKHLVEFR